jgi:hypothetical protein
MMSQGDKKDYIMAIASQPTEPQEIEIIKKAGI